MGELSDIKDKAIKDLQSHNDDLIVTAQAMLDMVASISTAYKTGMVYRSLEMAVSRARRRNWK